MFPFKALYEAATKDFGRVGLVCAGDMLVYATAILLYLFGLLVAAGDMLVYATALLFYHFGSIRPVRGVLSPDLWDPWSCSPPHTWWPPEWLAAPGPLDADTSIS